MNPKIKLIFFGTPEIAVKCLEALKSDSSFEILAVITQEDKPVGRKKVMTPPDVKVYAESVGIPVYQPTNISDDVSLYEQLALLPPDYNVVVAYGQIMSQKWLDLPCLRSVNLHVSLLPKYRGASPMQETLKHGDTTTGVSIQEMAFLIDTGGILSQEEFEIEPNDTFLEIYEKAGSIGARLLVETLKSDFDATSDQGRLTGTIQDNSKASYCTKITKEDGFVDFATLTATEIYNKYRAYKLWPGIWTMMGGKRMKLTEVMTLPDADFENLANSGQMAGLDDDSTLKSMSKTKDRLFARCEEGILEILRCQVEGGTEISAEEFLRGN
ncbi:MAG: methionyl-tRNA formyltransferase [Candidatus Gracilibacteria bacterium]|nr:methionyl-tRNA formyltransferase [Candidatus Gracilibacteria bacterium]